jgi:hypothetical protein
LSGTNSTERKAVLGLIRTVDTKVLSCIRFGLNGVTFSSIIWKKHLSVTDSFGYDLVEIYGLWATGILLRI